MGFRPDSLKSWLRSLLDDGGSLRRSGNGIVSYTPASTTGTETLTNKTLTAPTITTPTITTPSWGNGSSIETAAVATTDATATVCWSKALADSTVYELDITLVGRRSGTAGRAVYRRRVTAYVEAGTLTLGTPDTIGTDLESTGSYDITIDNSGTTVRVRATGANSHTIAWTARVAIASASV
jgi:hypothetical protein